jgi:hypothetical protein
MVRSNEDFHVGEEKRKALIGEIYGRKIESMPLPPEVLYFSSVFDWVEPDKEDIRKSQITELTAKLPPANTLNVRFGASIAGGLAG